MAKRNRRAVRLSFMLRCAVIMLAVSLFAEARTADQLIQQVEARYNNARTLEVQFTENFAAGGRSRPSETGTLILQKTGKMRWQYTQPVGKLFILDGKQVFLYSASDNRVEKMPVKNTEDMRAPLAFLLGRLELKKEFRDFKVRPAPDGKWLDANAKNDRVPYEKISLLIDPAGPIRAVDVTGRDGSEMSFQFKDEILNPRVDAALFHFEPPPGAQVVDGVDFASEGK